MTILKTSGVADVDWVAQVFRYRRLIAFRNGVTNVSSARSRIWLTGHTLSYRSAVKHVTNKHTGL
jgi:hypothetical protein